MSNVLYLHISIHRIPMHVSGLLISLRGPANTFFVRHKYVTLTGNRLHIGHV